jgi:hypothetical protein
MFSYVTNDAAAILASAAATFCLILLACRPLTPRLLLTTGVIIGLAALTKASVVVFAPIAVVLVLSRQTFKCLATEKPSPLKGLKKARGGLIAVTMLVLPMLLIAAPWYVWNAIQYGDPFGIQPHARTFWALATPRSMGEALLFTLSDGAYQIRSMWYGVASGVVMSTHSVVIAPAILFVLSMIGYMRCWRVLLRRFPLVLLALGAVCAAVFVAYVNWLTRFDSVTGRLLLPGYLALVLLVTLGLAYSGWSRAFLGGLRLVSGAAIVFGAVIITGCITLPWFYTMFTVSPGDVPPLAGDTARFGDVEFMGYRIEPDRLSDDVLPRATVCWRSLREDERLSVPHAFAFHIVGQDGTVYYARDSYPGLGLYTNWQPGRAFCDRFTMEQRQPPIPGNGYRVAIGLFDPGSQKRVPEDDGKSFVGWVAAPGEPLTDAERANAPYNFEDVYLLDVAHTQSDGSFSVQTEWGTGDWQPRPLTMFIHLVDENGQLVTQLDLPLGGDDYPSALWGDNERTVTTTYDVPLPGSLPAGEYSILLGLYDSQTLERLAAVDTNGTPQEDKVVRIGAIEQ